MMEPAESPGLYRLPDGHAAPAARILAASDEDQSEDVARLPRAGLSSAPRQNGRTASPRAASRVSPISASCLSSSSERARRCDARSRQSAKPAIDNLDHRRRHVVLRCFARWLTPPTPPGHTRTLRPRPNRRTLPRDRSGCLDFRHAEQHRPRRNRRVARRSGARHHARRADRRAARSPPRSSLSARVSRRRPRACICASSRKRTSFPCSQQGRHRYFRIASPLVAQMIEAVGAVAAVHAPPRHRRPVRATPPMREARICYDHLAGRLAVELADRLIAPRLPGARRRRRRGHRRREKASSTSAASTSRPRPRVAARLLPPLPRLERAALSYRRRSRRGACRPCARSRLDQRGCATPARCRHAQRAGRRSPSRFERANAMRPRSPPEGYGIQ